MTVPTYEEFMLPVLRALASGQLASKSASMTGAHLAHVAIARATMEAEGR